MGFKGREREGRIELDQVKGREKVRKYQQFEIATKVRKTIFFTKLVSILPFDMCYIYIDMALIYYLHNYFI